MNINIISIILALIGLISAFYFLIKNIQLTNSQLKREQDISRRMYELAILKELGDRIGYSLNVQQIIDVIVNSLHQFIEYSAVSYMLLNPEKIIFKVQLEKSVNQKFIDDIRDRMLGSLSALLDKEYTKYDVKEIISGAIIIDEINEPVRSFFNIPLVIDEKVVGIITVADTKVGLYKEEDMTILYKIIRQASKAVTSLEGVVRSEQAKINAMVESMDDGVIMTDIDYRIVVINQRAKDVVGLNSKVEINIFDFIDNLEGKFDIRGKLEESVKLNKVFKTKEILIGDKFYEISVFPVTTNVSNNKETVGGAVVFHDVTSEKSIEQLREQFTSMLVHELRTPLSGIKKISELLRLGPTKIGKSDYQDYIKLINADSSSMLVLVNDILDIAKLEAGKFDIKKEDKDIKEIINNRIEFFKPSIKDAKLEIDVEYDKALPDLIPIDEAGIKQVLNNLISNAIKFTRANGSIEISVIYHRAKNNINQEFGKLKNKLRIPLPEDKFTSVDNSIVVAVSDTGLGINQSEIKELFSKFKQLGNRNKIDIKGTGLGLTIVKGIIEEHGGIVGVVSEVDIGSIFYFVLPL